MPFCHDRNPARRNYAADALRCLDRDPLFHGRTNTLQIEHVDDGITLTGTLPTYYLKQMLQEVLRPLRINIDNHVHVVSANGVSAIDRD